MRFANKYGHHIDTCNDEIGLRAQNIGTILIVNTFGRVYVIIYKER